MAILKLKKKKYCYGSPIVLEDVDMEKVLVSIKISAGEKSYKYFISFLYEYNKIKPFHIMLPKMSAYVKSNDCQTNRIFFAWR